MMMNTTDSRGLKMRDCVFTAAVLLQLDDVVGALVADEIVGDLEVEKEIKQLVRCGNLVLGEIAADYLPLEKEEELTAANGRIEFARFAEKPYDITAVKRSGKSVPFRLFYDCIMLPDEGDYKVRYTYEPVALDISGVSGYSGGKPSYRCVAYGIAAEYSLISGMSDDAGMWDKRFKDSLFAANIAKSEMIIKPREWR